MIKKDFLVDYAYGKVVTFLTDSCATVLIGTTGEVLRPSGVYPLRAVGLGGFVLVYDTDPPFDFLRVRFRYVADQKGRECPDWDAVRCSRYKNTGPMSFDASVEEVFPYTTFFVALHRAITRGSVEEVRYVLRKIPWNDFEG